MQLKSQSKSKFSSKEYDDIQDSTKTIYIEIYWSTDRWNRKRGDDELLGIELKKIKRTGFGDVERKEENEWVKKYTRMDVKLWDFWDENIWYMNIYDVYVTVNLRN